MAQVNEMILSTGENLVLSNSKATQSYASVNELTASDKLDSGFSTILAEESVNPIREVSPSPLPEKTPFSELLTDDLSGNGNVKEETTPDKLLIQISAAQSYNTDLDESPSVSGQILPHLPQTELAKEADIKSQTEFSDNLLSHSELISADSIEVPTQVAQVPQSGINTAGQDTQNIVATNTSMIQPKLEPASTPQQALSSSLESTTDVSAKTFSNSELGKTLSGDVDGKAGVIKDLSQGGSNEVAKQTPIHTPIQTPIKLATEPVASEVLDGDFQVDEGELLNSLEKASSNSQNNSSQLTSGMNLLNRAEGRVDTPQLQVSLKQAGEQTPPMQEMIQRFSPVMKQQLIAMVNNGIGQAEIRLDPPELGHMLVKIQVQQDQTQVQFHVTQPGAKELLEQATPRLRDMLAEQGMELSDSEISYHDNNSQERGGQGSEQDGNSSLNSGWNETATNDEQLVLNIASTEASGIDYYA
ncbi:flagellar hook-length control protein FliK [Parashewanella spongiae]|uniref:flagellar hook-length control protein FliK n=1 Tax=Parashewanella spongiae TaxID=342950 RepID=UPI0014048F80|nr:flagellar hook-length control protein FliK [Parashewanella spongiae]MCL1076637.1 flagellar hook-length control protein FliK [Parashewanella spongiae]